LDIKKQTFLALDVGEARIGLAVGSSDSSFVFGRSYLVRRNLEADIDALKASMRQERADALVLGLPKRTDGQDSLQTQKVRDLAKVLEEAGCTVFFEDERFTTRIATANILQSGKKKKKRQEKGLVDEASAILILESFLEKLRKNQFSPSKLEGP